MITYLRSGQGLRRLVRIGLILTIFAACLTAIELQYGSRESPDPTGSRKGGLQRQDGKETTGLSSGNTGYGFTVSFHPGPDAVNNLSTFKRDVDLLVENGQEWVRFGIIGWEVVETWGDHRSMEWNEPTLKRYDQAIAYARNKGLSINLVTADGHMGLDASNARYRAMMGEYWSTLAQRYAPDVKIWQIYNEVDAGHYSQRTVFDGELSDSYLAGLKSMLQIGRKAIKDPSPATLITTNTMGWPMNDTTEERWVKFFDAVGPTLDVIALDVYPAHYTKQIAKLSDRVEHMKSRYDKPVIIAEVGLQTCKECWSEEDQGKFVAAAIHDLAKADPMAIIAYELRDPPKSTGFGLLHADRTEKEGFNQIIIAMNSG
jgi:hypothetical protein